MQLIKQLTRGQCLIAAHAMCMDMPLEKAIAEIGHDGMERIHEELEEPFCFRGFHQQELIDHALDKGVAIINIEALPGSMSGGPDERLYVVQFNVSPEQRIMEYLQYSTRAIILGQSLLTKTWHAVAWDGSKIYDPQGSVYLIQDAEKYRFGQIVGLLLYEKLLLNSDSCYTPAG